MKEKQLFGILLVGTLIFVLWLYDTNRLSGILGIVRGKVSVAYPSTGAVAGLDTAPGLPTQSPKPTPGSTTGTPPVLSNPASSTSTWPGPGNVPSWAQGNQGVTGAQILSKLWGYITSGSGTSPLTGISP